MENSIKKRREGRGISQAELAKRVHIAAGIMSMIESGRAVPTLEELRQIAGALKCSPTDLYSATVLQAMYGKDAPGSPPQVKERRAITGKTARKITGYLPPALNDKVDALVRLAEYNSRSEWLVFLIRQEIERKTATLTANKDDIGLGLEEEHTLRVLTGAGME